MAIAIWRILRRAPTNISYFQRFLSTTTVTNKLKKKLIMVFRIRLIDVIIKGKDDKIINDVTEIIRRKRKNKGHTKRFRLWKNIWKNDKKERRRIRRGKREKKEE